MEPHRGCSSLLLGFVAFFFLSGSCLIVGRTSSGAETIRYEAVKQAGRLEDGRLVECSGLEASPANRDLLWAINDGGNGPYVYALGYDGRSLGRIRIEGAENRDWEGLDTFIWKGRPMILIADVGDNKQRHQTHTLYIVQEPLLAGGGFDESAVARVKWKIIFSYPDRGHDAEGVAVDTNSETVLILTKRDNPPLLFEIPLKPTPTIHPTMARLVTPVGRIPPPTPEDLSYVYGKYRSQPTALDLSSDGRVGVVLTYKHAYLFYRKETASWAATFGGIPKTLHLPLPQENLDFRQREAICFTPDNRSLLVTSEGRGAYIFNADIRF